VVVATDAGHNRLAGVAVTFTVTAGGGTSAPDQRDADDRQRRTGAGVLTLGPQEGIENNGCRDLSGEHGNGRQFLGEWANSGRSGFDADFRVVLDNTNRPIQGVTLRLYQPYQGQVNNVPVQVAAVQSDARAVCDSAGAGGAVQAEWRMADSGEWFVATVEYDIVTVSGQNNTVECRSTWCRGYDK